jgi:hypothetical protein
VTLETLRQWAVPGALLMGGALFASGIVVWAFPSSYEYADDVRIHSGPRLYLFEGLQALAMLGLLAALVGLYRDQAGQAGRLGSVGFWTAFVGTALNLAGTVLGMGSMALRGEYRVLDGILFDGTLLAWFLGFLLFGIATLRAKVFPAWVGILLLGWYPFFWIVAALAGYAATFVVVGLVWLAIGYALWLHRSVPQYREAAA